MTVTDPFASLTDNDLLRSIWAALNRLEEAVGALVVAPVVNVDPPDLGDIVTAVTGLKPGPSAEEIARAIAEVLRFPTPEPDESLAKVALALEKLSNQLKGVGNSARGGGGGSVSVQPAANSNVSVVPASLATAVLVGANSARKGVMIHNVSNGTIYVKLGAGAASDSYSFLMDPDSFYEMPGLPVYTGPITGFWVGPEIDPLEGSAVVTELA